MRLQKVLPTIISEFQNGQIKGSFIDYTIRTIIDIIHYSTANKNCSVAFFGFEKPFDQLEWNLTEKTLAAFNFGDFFQKCCKKHVLKSKQLTTCIINNSYASELFKIQRGIKPGVPFDYNAFYTGS